MENNIINSPVTTKVAVFSGTTKDNLISHNDFTIPAESFSPDAIFEQYNQVFDFIKSIIATREKSCFNIPEIVITEALVNSFVHRDYKIPANNIISIFDNRIEFLSTGGIPEPFTLPDIVNGVSYCRNPQIAAKFHEKSLMFGLGTGIRRILDAFSDLTDFTQPSILAFPASFLTIVYGRPDKLDATNVSELQPNENSGYLTNEEKVYNYIKIKKFASRKEIETLLGSSSFPALQAINALLTQNKIKVVGNARSTKYILSD